MIVTQLRSWNYGLLAQLGEHLFCTQGVSGSIPLRSTIYRSIELSYLTQSIGQFFHFIDDLIVIIYHLKTFYLLVFENILFIEISCYFLLV